MALQMRLISLVVISGAVAVLYLVDPATTALFPSCPFHLWTGWYCPGCGALRAAHALLHGHVGQALHDNPFVLAGGFAVAAAATIDRMRGPGAASQLERLTSPAAVRFLAIAAAIFAVARNMPMRPFVWMVP